MTEPNDGRRLELVKAAQERWIEALTDLGGRNTLLYYKDRRAGTLDLAHADPDALQRFVKTGSIRLTRLFKDADMRADAIRRAQTIHRKARELLEERGIRAGYLATGMARWDELFLMPAAPVLLRGLTITPTRARYDDFELALDDDEEVNPVLLHKLASVFGAVLENVTPQDATRQLARAAEAAEIPGFEIAPRRVIGTFTYAKLPMVRDMEAAGDLLADSDLVAAIAGDPHAQELVSADRGTAPAASPENGAQHDGPEHDYSVLDADSSQRSAIDAVLAGRSLVIHGPPGTGKSQTIANLIAAVVTRGRKVLFVAEKRAAIDAVLSRLVSVHLGEMVLDIHEGTRDRQRIAADLGATLDLAEHTTAPDVADLHRRLVDRQKRLRRHSSALHEVHEPWRLSPYQVQSALLGIPAAARVPARLPDPEGITPEIADRLRDELREFAHLGGFTLRPESTPWFGAAIRGRSQAREAIELAVTLGTRTLPKVGARLAAACAETGLAAPADFSERAVVIRLFAAISRTLARLDPAVYASGPASLAGAVGEEGGFGFRERHALRKRARSPWVAGPESTTSASFTSTSAQATSSPRGKPERETLRAALADAAAELEQWRALRLPEDEGLPRLPPEYEALTRQWDECARQINALRAFVPVGDDVDAAVTALMADQDTPWKLPRLQELARRFGALGLVPLLDDLARAQVSADLAASAFDHVWYSSILDRIRVRDPAYAAEGGEALDEIADEFRRRDIEHLAANRSRVRLAWANQLRDTVDRHPLQARVIRKQAALRRGHLPLRRLLDQAGDVLFALKPCWAMSPLMVSQVLPAVRLFDVVIFDEASQIVPADAIGSIIRAHQVVVAGDDHQLPPTSFFRQVDPGDDEEDDETMVSFGAGFESVLDALTPLLPTCPLNWHYRSRDERLVAFSNDRIYGGALTTFPGVARDDCLRHVVVAQDSAPGQESSVTAEVREVVALVLLHARTRPRESLGVIALGLRHAERIDAELRSALAAAPELEPFFAEDAPEPFFVKNLERVQGDERDAIILSIGYGKHRDGRMRYQWGPLLRDGGERRLNVAATRAKRRLTVVSSFSSHDVDPARLTKAGARLLAEYLEYAGSGGTPVAASGSGSGLGAFESDVSQRLAECGITVVPQYGVGGYRVDFAVAHPDDPSRMILAVEADGASYRDSGSVRDRDRLRKEHLERLGWRVHRLWSTSWFRDPQTELAKLRRSYDRAVADSPPPPEPESAPEPGPSASPAPEATAPSVSTPQPAPGAAPPAEPTPAPGSSASPAPEAAAPSGPASQPEPTPLPDAPASPTSRTLDPASPIALPAASPIALPAATPPALPPESGSPALPAEPGPQALPAERRGECGSVPTS
ncbi:MAG: AAA family ATPase [Streptosporangiaceae bacterium]|nr:AAA family ATPase [Streptosporangiaceae bacterium]